MYSINHHLISIRLALEALPLLGYELDERLSSFIALDPNEGSQALSLHQALTFHRTLRACYPDPILALEIAQFFPAQVYGMFGFGLMSSASVRESLLFAVRFQKLSYTLMTLSLEIGPIFSQFCFAPTNLNIEADLAAFFADRDLAASKMTIPNAHIEPIPLEKVTLVHDGYGKPELYQRHFACEVEFEAQVSSLVYKTANLDKPSHFRNSDAFEICVRECEKQLALVSEETDIVGQVRQELSSRPGYLQDIDSISRQLNLSERTLRRRLIGRAHTFQQIQSEVRFQQAREYLARPNLSVAEVSELLGFSEPGNFSQAFKRWSGGLSPLKYRQS